MRALNTKKTVNELLSCLLATALLSACATPEDEYLGLGMLPEAGEPINSKLVELQGLSPVPRISQLGANLGIESHDLDTASPSQSSDPVVSLIDVIEEEPGTPALDLIDSDFTMPEAEEAPEDAFGIEADGDSDEKVVLISQLSPSAFDKTCVALEAVYADVDDMVELRAECTYELVSKGGLFDEGDGDVCNNKIDTCAEDRMPAGLPIALCELQLDAPEDCQVSQQQIESCLVQHRTSLQALTNVDVCDTETDALNTVQAHRDAFKCIDRLAASCPSLLDD